MIVINGKEEQLGKPLLVDLLKAKQLEPVAVIVELNGQIVAKNKYAETHLKDGDRLELIQYMGGG